MRAALEGRTPVLPSRWFWGAAAELHRDRTRALDHYPSRLDRELYSTHAPMLLGLVEPDVVVDLAPAANRHVRVFASALAATRRRARCVLHDRVGPRLVAAVQRLAADYPSLEVSGVLTADAGRPADMARTGVRLVLASCGGPDGPDVEDLVHHLRAVACSLGPHDAALVSLDLGADPNALVRACHDEAGRAQALHRAALAELVAASGGAVDVDAFALDARWDPGRRCVETRLRPVRPVAVELPGYTLRVDRPIRTGRVATWTRPAFRRVAARAGLVLGAWLPDLDERRAIALVRPTPARSAAACARGDHLL